MTGMLLPGEALKNKADVAGSMVKMVALAVEFTISP